MKRLLSFALVSILLMTAAAFARQAAATVTGTWDITIESPQGKRTNMLIIKQEGDKLMGMMKSPRGERPLDSVTVKGNEITMVMTIQFQGSDMVVTYKGKVEKDSMKGEADFGGLASGEWSAVPHKEEAAAAAPAAAPATAPAGAMAAANITGVWKFAVTLDDGRTGEPTFTFKQEGETLTGTYKGPLGEAPVNGTIKGNDAVFSIKVSPQGQEIVVTYKGKVEGKDTMSGTIELPGQGGGKWTGKRQ